MTGNIDIRILSFVKNRTEVDSLQSSEMSAWSWLSKTSIEGAKSLLFGWLSPPSEDVVSIGTSHE